MVPDRLSFLLTGANEWWIGDVNGRFSLIIFVEESTSVIMEEEDEEDDKEGTSNGGGGAGEANSCVIPLVAAVPRDLNVIP